MEIVKKPGRAQNPPEWIRPIHPRHTLFSPQGEGAFRLREYVQIGRKMNQLFETRAGGAKKISPKS
jgi:hypothetical protein